MQGLQQLPAGEDRGQKIRALTRSLSPSLQGRGRARGLADLGRGGIAREVVPGARLPEAGPALHSWRSAGTAATGPAPDPATAGKGTAHLRDKERRGATMSISIKPRDRIVIRQVEPGRPRPPGWSFGHPPGRSRRKAKLSPWAPAAWTFAAVTISPSTSKVGDVVIYSRLAAPRSSTTARSSKIYLA